jgi:xylulokinase
VAIGLGDPGARRPFGPTLAAALVFRDIRVMVTLGIDCGTSALKTVLVDAHEAVLASASRSYRPDHPQPLWSEQDPQVWLTAMLAAIGDLRKSAPAAMKALGAIGFSGQMHGAVLLDRDDRPLRPAMLHNDARAFAEAGELWQKHPHLAGVVGVKPMAGFTAPKLMWLRRREPQVFARIACVLLPKDYLRLYLTGEKRTDMSDAAGTWWLDEAERRWSSDALAASGVDPAWVPPLCEGCEAAGRLTPSVADELGLPRDVVVAAGGGDAAVGAVGLGAVRPGDAFISLGTATQLIVASDRYRAAPERLVHSFAHALPKRWYRMAAMLNGAGALAFAARLVGREVAELEAEAAIGYEGPGETIFLPYLSGERTPHDDPHARGVVFGLGEDASRVDLTRAVMEGVAFTLADARDCLAAAGDSFTQVGLIGGGAKSALWTRMIAAALGCEIVRYRGGETGPAFGAARLARLAATGEAPEDVCKPPEIADVAAPNPALAQAFARARERFVGLYRALKPEFLRAAADRG